MIKRVTEWIRQAVSALGTLIVTICATVYLMVVRSFLYVLTAYIAVYFLSGTSLVRDTVQQLVSSEIPGFITTGTIQWGPLPSSVTLCDARVHGEHTQEVIAIELFEAEISWPSMVTALTKLALVADAPIPVLIRHARFVNPKIHMTLQQDGELDLVRAFHIPSDEPSGPIKSRRIHVEHAKMEGARVRIDMPEVRIDTEDLDLVIAGFLLEGIDDATFMVPRASATAVDFHMRPHFRPFPSLDRLTVPIRNLKIDRFRFMLNHFEAKSISAAIDGGSFDARMAMDFVRAPTPLWKGNAVLDLPASSNLLSDLFDGFVHGAMRAEMTGHGSFEELNLAVTAQSPRLDVSGHPVNHFEVDARIQPRITPEGRLNHPFSIVRMGGEVLGGRLDAGPFEYVMRWARDAPPSSDGDTMPRLGTYHAFGGRVALEGIDPWRLLETLDLSFGLDVVPFLHGAADGVIYADGYFDEETDALELVAETPELSMDWIRLGGWPLGDVLKVSGQVTVSQGSEGSTPPIGDTFEAHTTASLEEVRITSGSDELVVDADVDILRETADAYADLRIRDLRQFLGHFDVSGIGGRTHLSRLRILGSWWDPFIEAHARISGARESPETPWGL